MEENNRKGRVKMTVGLEAICNQSDFCLWRMEGYLQHELDVSGCLLAAFQGLHLTAGCTAVSCPVCCPSHQGLCSGHFWWPPSVHKKPLGSWPHLKLQCFTWVTEKWTDWLLLSVQNECRGSYDLLSPLGTKHFPHPSCLLGLFLTFSCPELPDPCPTPNPAQTQQLLLPWSWKVLIQWADSGWLTLPPGSIPAPALHWHAAAELHGS